MVAIIQRVSEAGVTIGGTLKSSIGSGLMVLIGIAHNDTEEDADWLCKKIIHMRIFGDEQAKMNRCLKDTNGELLVISQFTLQASTKKGNRPSFIEAARPEIAIPLYEKFISLCATELGTEIKTGEFGADMKVNLINDGPVTIVLDSKNKK
jgi:D-tyrosyl-tRNA(Tyr) deacylase